MGAIAQMTQNRLTVLFPKVIFPPSLCTLIAIMAKEFSCTKEVGIPLVKEANKRRDAVMMETVLASIGVRLVIPLPAAFTTR